MEQELRNDHPIAEDPKTEVEVAINELKSNHLICSCRNIWLQEYLTLNFIQNQQFQKIMEGRIVSALKNQIYQQGQLKVEFQMNLLCLFIYSMLVNNFYLTDLNTSFM